jgi:predicted transcriptional regulator
MSTIPPCPECGTPIPANGMTLGQSLADHVGYCERCMEYKYHFVPIDDGYECLPVLGSSGFQVQGSWPDNRGAGEPCGEPDYEAVWERLSAMEILVRLELEKRKQAAPPGGDGGSHTHEQAAVLKTLLRAGNVRMIVEMIVDKVSLSEKTVRKVLRSLRDLGLVEEPEPKKGYCLTAEGQRRALKLSADAGAELLKNKPGR